VEVRPGYKQTEIGVIPEDWDVSKVGDEFFVQLGKMLDAERNTGVPKPYLGNKAVQWGSIDSSDLPTVPMSRSDLERFRLEAGDLLVCEGGEVGRAAIWNAPMDECYYQKALHRLRPIRGFQPRLLVDILRQWSERGVLANYVTQTSIAHLPREKFLEVPIPRPHPAEQRAIAAALGDVDALLAGLDQLIAKKRDLKQAAMQQLLTGQTRLPGFKGEWDEVEFGVIAAIRNAKVIASSMPAGTRCVELESIDQGTGRLLVINEASGLGSKYSFKKGDVLFGRLRAYLRKYWLATFDGVCSTEIWPLIARDGRLLGDFLFLLVQTSEFMSAAGVSYGTHMPRSDWCVLEKLRVRLPPSPEQAAIAAVLFDMDAELAALEARRCKTLDIKQAMMQELLTGKTRLPHGEKVNV